MPTPMFFAMQARLGPNASQMNILLHLYDY